MNTFSRGDLVRKRSGSQWQGRIVGKYSTTLTPEGYAVESDVHAGSVQIYPAAALQKIEIPLGGGMMNAEQVEKRKVMLLAQEQDDPPALWWMSFCDTDKPVGQQFLGVAIVEAPGLMHAHQKAWDLDINPGGEMLAFQVEGIPAEYHDRLLSRAEAEAADRMALGDV